MYNRVVIPVRRYLKGTAPMNRLLAYAKGFSQLGVEVYFYFLITDEKREKVILNDDRIHCIYLWEQMSERWNSHRAFALIKGLLLFRKQIKKCDAVLTYGRANYMLVTALAGNQKARVFCEITEHPEYLGKSWLQRISIRVSLWLMKKLDGLLVISNSLKDYFINQGIKPNNVCVVNMFVDATRFERRDKTDDEKYIAYCGSVSSKKDGVDILIKSFAIFYERHSDYKLYIIGGKGDDEPLSFFENLVNQLGVQDAVIFTGKVAAEELPHYLVNASILALSRPDSLQARNGFPTKLGEYLATGNPVLVTNVGEIPLFIKHGENGFIAEESNVDDFAKKLIWIADHYSEATLIGEKGKQLAHNEFSYLTQSKVAYTFMLNHEYEK